jgi:ATP-binding cassette subfamily F protein 3
MELDTRGTVLQCVQTMTGLSRPDAQNLLGKFLFSGWDEHEKPVTILSGGERRRLALAVTVSSGANFLVLDEPTNHLDLESREALEAALEAFPGTILLVSHDRALLDAVAERTLAVEDCELHTYEGGWAEMLRRREQRATRAAEPEQPKVVKKTRPPRPKKAQPSELEKIEAEIAKREAEVAELERQLAADWSNVETVAAHKQSRDALAALLDRWEQLFEEAQV